MDYTIVWSDEAKENYRLIALYLLDAFGFTVADRFTDIIDDKLRILEKMSFIRRRLDSLTAVRKLPLQPHNMIYYTVSAQEIIILNILDGRQGALP